MKCLDFKVKNAKEGLFVCRFHQKDINCLNVLKKKANCRSLK